MDRKRKAVLAVCMSMALACGTFCAGCSRQEKSAGIAQSDCSGYEKVEFYPISTQGSIESFLVRADGSILGGDASGTFIVSL